MLKPTITYNLSNTLSRSLIIVQMPKPTKHAGTTTVRYTNVKGTWRNYYSTKAMNITSITNKG